MQAAELGICRLLVAQRDGHHLSHRGRSCLLLAPLHVTSIGHYYTVYG